MREERSRGQENEKSRTERGEEREGGGGALWVLLCRNVNTLQRWQKTMTPRGEEGASVSVPLHVRACVRTWAGAPTAPQGAEAKRRR